jgi:hypothetical protein
MRLIHYSDAPLASVYSVEQSGDRYDWHGGRKPVGLWVSVDGDDDWRAWCKAENFRDVDSQCATHIVLTPKHRVLIVDSGSAMLDFNRQYGVERDYYGKWKEQRIDWPRVARDYHGIVIAPYQWAHRLDEPCTGWYYSWDCASGCIWNADAVAEMKPVREQIAA